MKKLLHEQKKVGKYFPIGIILYLVLITSMQAAPFGGNSSEGMAFAVSSETKLVDVPVSGTAVDSNQEPLPGVTVSVQGTTTGTATDLNGRYALTVPEGSTLVFSFIGFETQRISVGGQSIIDVTLTEDLASLDEVVVVGYGTQKKVNLTGAVASVDGD